MIVTLNIFSQKIRDRVGGKVMLFQLQTTFFK